MREPQNIEQTLAHENAAILVHGKIEKSSGFLVARQAVFRADGTLIYKDGRKRSYWSDTSWDRNLFRDHGGIILTAEVDK